MRNILILLSVFVLFALAGCEPPRIEVRPLPTPEPTATPSPTPTPALASPVAPPVPATPLPTPEANKAGTNAVYLARRVSISTDSGIRGFDPGTEVQVIAQSGEKMTVGAEGMKFEVAASDTTTDFEVVKALIPQVRAIDAAVAQKRVLTAEEVEAQRLNQERNLARAQMDREVFAKKRRLDELPKLIASAEARRKEMFLIIGQKGTSYNTPEGRARDMQYKEIQKTIQALEAEQRSLQSELQRAEMIR